MIELIVILFIIGAFSAWWLTRGTYIVKVKKDQVMEFKSAMDLAGLPIITFYQGENKYNFLLDTGSNVSYINDSVDIKTSESVGTDSFIGACGTAQDCIVATVVLYHSKKSYTQVVRKTNLSAAFTEIKNATGVQLSGILGNDFFTQYQYCLDFKELVCYSRK